MKGTVIVTGGCGYIGSHTVVSLIENQFDVVIIDDFSNSNKLILDRIKAITGDMPIFENIDLKDLESTRKALGNYKEAVAIIHLAAHKAVSESVRHPLKYYQNNFLKKFSKVKGLSYFKKIICQADLKSHQKYLEPNQPLAKQHI